MKVEKIQIKEKPRKLTVKWAVNLESSDIDITKEAVDVAANLLQEEIDWEIMCDLMKTLGWTQIDLENDRMPESKVHEIKEWCRTNLKGIYRARGRTWIFSKEKDAVLFSLRWV